MNLTLLQAACALTGGLFFRILQIMKTLHLKIGICFLLAPVAQLAAQSEVGLESLSRQLDEIAAQSAVAQEGDDLNLQVFFDDSKHANRLSFVEDLAVSMPEEIEYHAIRDERMAMYSAAHSYQAENEGGKGDREPKDGIAAGGSCPSVSDFAIAAASGLPGHCTLIVQSGKSRQTRWPVSIAVDSPAEALFVARWSTLLYFSIREGYASGSAVTLKPVFTSSAFPPLSAALQLDRLSRFYLSFFDVPILRSVFPLNHSFGGIV